MVPTDDAFVRAIRYVAPVVTIVFTGVVLAGLLGGQFGSEGRMIIELDWGKITLLDTYLAFLVSIIWIWLRQSRRSAALLTVGVLVLGSAVIWGFVTWAAYTSRDRRQLLTGAGDVRLT